MVWTSAASWFRLIEELYSTCFYTFRRAISLSKMITPFVSSCSLSWYYLFCWLDWTFSSCLNSFYPFWIWQFILFLRLLNWGFPSKFCFTGVKSFSWLRQFVFAGVSEIIFGKKKKWGKIRPVQQTVIPASSYFLTIIVKTWFLEGRLWDIPTQFWDILIISYFSRILSLNSFVNLWDILNTKFIVIDIKIWFTCAKSNFQGKTGNLQNIMVTIIVKILL